MSPHGCGGSCTVAQRLLDAPVVVGCADERLGLREYTRCLQDGTESYTRQLDARLNLIQSRVDRVGLHFDIPVRELG